MADPIYPLDELRDLPDLANTSLYPDELLEGLVFEFTAILARHPQGQFGAQSLTVLRSPAGPGQVLLPSPGATVTAISVDDTAASIDQLAGLTQDRAGLVSGGWWGDCRAVRLEVTFGTDVPLPPGLKRACGLFVWREALSTVNPNTSNAYLTTNTELQVIERASTADWSANPPRPTGWTDVDRLINQSLTRPIGIG